MQYDNDIILNRVHSTAPKMHKKEKYYMLYVDYLFLSMMNK